MADDTGWYARKMAQMRGQQPLPVVQRPPVQQYQQPVAPYQQNPQQAPPGAWQPEPAVPETLTEMLEMQKHGKGLKPGKGAKLNPEPCPGCGGALYYADLGLKRRGPPPVARCFTCGFNELFEQGLESNWQNGS